MSLERVVVGWISLRLARLPRGIFSYRLNLLQGLFYKDCLRALPDMLACKIWSLNSLNFLYSYYNCCIAFHMQRKKLRKKLANKSQSMEIKSKNQVMGLTNMLKHRGSIHVTMQENGIKKSLEGIQLVKVINYILIFGGKTVIICVQDLPS